MSRFPPARGRHVRSKVSRTRLRVESLGDRVTPAVVVNGTPGDDVITARLVPVGSSDPRAVRILVNGVVKATVRLDPWASAPTSYFLARALEVNGRGGDDRIELGHLQFVTVTGGPGDDTLVGGDGRDSLVGGPGADDLSGGGDADTLVADTDDVRVVGGGGEDSLMMTHIRGTVAVTPTSLTLNGRTLSEADGTFSGIETARLAGSDTDDTLTATGLSRVVLVGQGGNDRLGADAATEAELLGGSGNDTLTATGTVRARLLGNGGNDRLEIDASSQAAAVGGYGDDTLIGGAGNDWMFGGPGDDLLSGGEDQFPAGAVNRLYGGTGNDVLHGGTRSNVLVGGSGNDRLVGGPLADWLYGEAGDDSLSGGDGNDQLNGDGPEPPLPPLWLGGGFGPGRRTVATAFGADDLDGGAGDDSLNGDPADTRLDGGAGADSAGMGDIRGRAVLTDTALTVNGRAVALGGIETVSMGGRGTDDVLDATAFTGFVRLYGGGGNDTLLAGSGGSYLDGGPGTDALEGGAGGDTLIAGRGDTRLVGGGGFDGIGLYEVRGTAVLTDTALTINGRPTAVAGIEYAVITGAGARDGGPGSNDRLDASGFGGPVTLAGGPGNDTLTAGAGGSVLDGQEGADVLIGGAGADTLDGGPGSDTLLGGPGADTFVPDADPGIAAEEEARSDYDPAQGDTGY